jgi:Predicted ATPase of the ABC class
VKCVKDQEYLREVVLKKHGLVAFVGEGAILPRRSGADDRPMPTEGGGVQTFKSPASLALEVVLPHKGRVRGMAIKRGVTLICGGGFHGKSTLLQALQFGVYT